MVNNIYWVMVTMSGKDERLNVMPECGCKNFKAWIVRESHSTGIGTLMWVNIDDYYRKMRGKWSFVLGKDRIVERAIDMRCSYCNRTASTEDFATMLRLFKREHLGDVR